FVAYPLVNAVLMAFQDVSIFDRSSTPFVGIQNFIDVMGDEKFLIALRNSAVWTFGSVSIQLALGLFGAVLLNQRIRARGAIRGLVLLPWATPSVLVALMWLWILDPNLGLANDLLRRFGYEGPSIAFLADQN